MPKGAPAWFVSHTYLFQKHKQQDGNKHHVEIIFWLSLKTQKSDPKEITLFNLLPNM